MIPKVPPKGIWGAPDVSNPLAARPKVLFSPARRNTLSGALGLSLLHSGYCGGVGRNMEMLREWQACLVSDTRVDVRFKPVAYLWSSNVNGRASLPGGSASMPLRMAIRAGVNAPYSPLYKGHQCRSPPSPPLDLVFYLPRLLPSLAFSAPTPSPLDCTMSSGL
jgi:hypothetical protein